MLESSDSKIGIREAIALIIIILFEKTTNDTASFLFKAAETAGWMVPLFSAAIILIPVFCIFCLLSRYKDKGLLEIIYGLTGKYIGFLINFTFFILNVLIICSNISDDCNVINTLFYPNTNIFYIIAALTGICCLMGMYGLKAVARASVLIIPYVLATYIVLVIFSMPWITPEFLFPLAGNGVGHVLIEGIKTSSIYQIIILLSICYPMFRNYKSFKGAGLIGLGASALALTFSFSLFLLTFDYPAVTILSYPFHTLSRMLRLTRFISNMEAAFLLCTTVMYTVYYSTYIYLVAATFSYTFKIKKVEPLILPIGAIVTLLCMIPQNSNDLYTFFNTSIVPIITIFDFVLPFFLLLISQLKGDYK